MLRFLFLILVAVPLYAEPRWLKGNTHTHTNLSDGDAPPGEVVRWYRDNGYDFLVITDHNLLTDVQDDKLLLIPGEELSDTFGKPAQPNDVRGLKVVHLNGIGISRLVKPQHGDSIVSTIQHDVDAIHEAGGIAAINHPNFMWSFTAAEMKQVNGFTLLEIANGHPATNMLGGGDAPSAEVMWDQLLSAGKKVFGVAVDDSHNFHGDTNTPVRYTVIDGRLVYNVKPVYYAPPGRGWIFVRAENLTAKNILDAIARGDFYASTGVVLESIEFDGRNLRVKIHEDGDSRYRTSFVRTKTYVRARVDDSNGRSAWTQPFFFAK
ncbi:MAG: CehA/McbA family metallohydrolase [Acidobacteriota bacterium]|nr:CehA/McbA family metallohydrolase [Acidobacteriota bacterium]